MPDRVDDSAVHGGWTGSSEDLREVLKFAADGVTVQGPSGALVWANDAAARQVGYETADEFLAAPIADVIGRYDLVDESGRPMGFDALPGRRATRGETMPSAVVGFRIHGDPEEHWSLVQATPVYRDGAIGFVVNVFHDITELKRTESKLRVLANAGAVLAASVDYQSTLQDLAEMVVPTLADWCVVDVVEESGLRRVAVAHPDPAMRAMAEDLQLRYPPNPERPGSVNAVMESGEPQIVPAITDAMLVAAARDEEYLAIIRGLGLRSAAVLPLIARGQTVGAITLARRGSSPPYRMEDRPFLEDLARRAGQAIDNSRLLFEANEAIRLRDDFLAMASHDMRTPISAILGNIQLAQRKLRRDASEGSKAVGRYLDNAERTTGKLANLVEELMDITMLRAGQTLPQRLERFDLADVVRDAMAEHQRLSPDHEIRIEGDEAVVGTWDRTRVERVLDNLIDNAVKYSPDGGDVVIRVGREHSLANVSVRDEGIGIPESDLPRLFNPYHRGSNAQGLRGIGLGLAGVREVLRQLGGDLTVESIEGSGSTFTIQLPLT